MLGAFTPIDLVIPHRLQPIPHAVDMEQLEGGQPEWIKHLPPKRTLTNLDADTDGCCDTGAWLKGHGKTCNKFWWQCDFGAMEDGDFAHLQDYEFISLKQGTGIVSLAATEQSRRCAPVPKSRGCSRNERLVAS